MAGPYYCDISAPGAWVGKTGLDKGANALLGLSGFQYLLDTVAAGSGPIYVRGSASDGTKMAALACDNLSGVFQRGESVTWNAGANVGVVSELTSNYPSVIEITTGAIGDLVNDDALVGVTSGATADVNGNSTQKTTIIDVDTNAGSTTAMIYVIGCKDDADYTVSYTDRAYIDVKGAVADGVNVTGTADYIVWQNFEIDQAGAAKSGFIVSATYSDYFFFKNLCAHDCGAVGINLTGSSRYGYLFQCVSHTNTGDGISCTGAGAKVLFCATRDNGGDGFTGGATSVDFIGCISHANTGDGIGTNSLSSLFLNCVFDGNSEHGININGAIPFVLGCRITNQAVASKAGIYTNSKHYVTGYNYFENNTTDKTTNYKLEIDDNTTSWVPGTTTPTISDREDQTDTDYGYVNSAGNDFATDYTDATDPTLRRSAITIPWS